MSNNKIWKPRRLVAGFLLVLGVWLLGSPSQGATWLDPSIKWKTLETPHFCIHYYDKIADTAQKMTSIAEEIYDRLSVRLDHTPDLKTDVVLIDNTDYTNGMTSVIPNPHITIYLADGGSNLRPVAYETWLKYVFVHEYTHLLHLDTVEGGARSYKLVFGRQLFPNALMPMFVVEGLATYFETERGYGGGRGKDPRWDAMMRMDVLEDNLKSLDQASVTTTKWPGGQTAYLYGVKFMEYLCEKYGEDKLTRLNLEYGDHLLYYGGLDSTFTAVYGRSLPELWKDWLAYAKDKYEKQRSALVKEGLTSFKPLTKSGFYILKPKWNPDGKFIYYSQNNADKYPELRRYNVAAGRDEKFREGLFFDDSLSFYGDELYFSKADHYANYYIYKDIYALNTRTGRLSQKTRGLRAADPAVSPDGKKLVYTVNESGRRTLWIKEGAKERMVGADQPDIQYFSPIFLPDGKKLAVAKWSNGGHQTICLIDAETGREEAVIRSGLAANPAVTPDQQYVVFDSDATGIPNLYAYHLASGQLYRVTNTIGGAMMPDVSPDGKQIAFVNYSSKGHDLAVMPFDPSTFKQTSQVIPAEPVKISPKVKTTLLTNDGIITSAPSKPQSASIEVQSYDYNPLRSILPKFWLPLTSWDENGAFTMFSTAGIDALQQNYFEAQYGFDTTARRDSYYYSYVNDQFLPQINYYAYDLPELYSDYWQRTRGGGVGMSFYNNRALFEYDRFALGFGYLYQNLSNITSLSAVSVTPSLGNIKGYYSAFRYLSTRQYQNSICPEDGIDLSVRMNSYQKDLGSDFNLNTYSGSAAGYLGLPGHNVLALSGTGWAAKGDPLVQSGYSWQYLDLPGYSSRFLQGNKWVTTKLALNFPIRSVETGWGYGLMFFDRFWGNLYYLGGDATYLGVKAFDLKRSLGLEVKLNMISGFGYLAGALTFGYARGLDPGGQDEYYFSFVL
jgi:hypothetical protein